jgi:ABC-2 type transport system permease protein
LRRLFSSELLRFRSRRLVVVLFFGTIIGTVVGCVIAAIESTPPTEAVLAEAHARAEREVANCLVADWTGVEFGGMTLEVFCREQFGEETQYLPSHLALVDLPGILEGVASITTILGLMMGASVVAVSWQTGTIGTILSWEPRRLRWFAARLLVIAVGVFAITLAWMAVVTAGITLTAATRGSTIGMDAEVWRSVVLTWVRIGAVASVAAVVGGGVAAIGRHTAAALAAVFVYTAVVEGLIRGFRPLWTPWLLGDNVVTVVSWRAITVELFPAGSYTLEPVRATLVILAYAAVILAFAFTFVRIRDVQ